METLKANRDILAGGLLVAVCVIVAAVLWISAPREADDAGAMRAVDWRADVHANGGLGAGQDANDQSDEPWMAFTPGDSTFTGPLRSGDATAPATGDVTDTMRDGASSAQSGDSRSAAGGPDNPGTANPAAPTDSQAGPGVSTISISGQVRHAVWGFPLSGVGVSSGAGAATLTNSAGYYALTAAPSKDGVTVAVSGPWLSRGATTLIARINDTNVTGLDFGVYPASEAAGNDWGSASDWRGASDAELAPLVPRVSVASGVFDGLSVAVARSVLDDARNGSQRERAMGELLGAWLSLASGDLGFDEAVDVTAVPGAVTALGEDPGTVLDLVRRADRVIEDGADPDWMRLRKVLDGRALVE